MENLGFNLQSFLINTGVFLLFFVLMHKLVLKKMGGVITEREAKMAEADKRGEESKRTLENAQSEFEKIIEKAKQDSRGILAESKRQAESEGKKIIEKAQIDAGEIIEKSKGVLVIEKEKMVSDFTDSLEKAVRDSLKVILSSQADKIDVDSKVFKEAASRV